MIVNDSEKLQKVAKKFSCLKCDYNTSRKSSFDKHLQTLKHKFECNGSKMIVKSCEKVAKMSEIYKCSCGKMYKYESGYYRHKKLCNTKTEELTDKELILTLVKQNTKLMEQNLEFVKNGTHNTSNSHNNSNNKTFNLQFFLNETCKDAMNITDFVDSIKLQLTDLENVGKIGYVNGISDIIIKNLKELDITQRPVHCTDKKREVLYVKDENKWEKEDEEKKNIRLVIKRIADKNVKLIPQFKEKHPDCLKSHSKYTEQYNKIIIESMGGPGNNDEEKEDKIIKNISKIITIDKE